MPQQAAGNAQGLACRGGCFLCGHHAPDTLTNDEAHVVRQALAGMLWSKQYVYYDLAEWLREHGNKPEEGVRAQVRKKDWFHMYKADVISMPDKWEYPWCAVWDLAFHRKTSFDKPP